MKPSDPSPRAPRPAEREPGPADPLLSFIGRGLSLLAERRHGAGRANPAGSARDAKLPADERRHVAGLMRINHAGEISAQALYHGQALTARDPDTRRHLLEAAREERDHLRWCEERLRELDDAPSKLQPLWYAGSFAIGALAGLRGDAASLGFVQETERQVSEHLDEHLQQLPETDERSRAILETMRRDEQRHGDEARDAGAAPVPMPVRDLMRQVAKLMKFGAYRL
ncbi:2-polyprenyl-3-methyl-6-methoxy-1,4-benzoquinone monooxygenase [Solimonas terrae]|uniref:3-demethoxyubiquinol 3-hydroxylase n=1 Tax=Solimonas terrae TaxID=1396819 RepID=A0A6M2BRJ7_9GAMM|nr:2-polyprenyl-3-methyl-6-methoxy-1,4-benzoquinone monooxygenase [Solimonas terrae]NGY05226.1 2-polyprenyl-3-methyl-6-methoxy-1,4-benzoquinone monooxygenase [Solimonas terrae]